jgi:hypothetical protein
MENLDGMTSEELREFYVKSCERKFALSLFPDKPSGYVKATRLFGAYAINKLCAVTARLEGGIATAITYEDICERIYNDLPEFAKW